MYLFLLLNCTHSFFLRIHFSPYLSFLPSTYPIANENNLNKLPQPMKAIKLEEREKKQDNKSEGIFRFMVDSTTCTLEVLKSFDLRIQKQKSVLKYFIQFNMRFSVFVFGCWLLINLFMYLFI